MAEHIALNADVRSQVGKGAARATRRHGRIPAIIYGDSKDPQPISLDNGLNRTGRRADDVRVLNRLFRRVYHLNRDVVPLRLLLGKRPGTALCAAPQPDLRLSAV